MLSVKIRLQLLALN